MIIVQSIDRIIERRTNNEKKLFALIVFTLMVLIPSCAKDKIIKGDGDPDISKYIGGDVKNETTFDSNYY